MTTGAVWTGIAWGTLLALSYGAASLFTHRLALRASSAKQFMAITIGGLLLRLTVALGVVALVVGVFSVHETAFMGSFFGVFIVTLTLEVLVLHRRVDTFTGDAEPAGDEGSGVPPDAPSEASSQAS
jgi:hypothetical protein